MEGEVGAEIEFVSDNVDHNLITIGHNTSYNRGNCCLCTPAVMQVENIHKCRRVTADEVKSKTVVVKSCTQSYY